MLRSSTKLKVLMIFGAISKNVIFKIGPVEPKLWKIRQIAICKSIFNDIRYNMGIEIGRKRPNLGYSLFCTLNAIELQKLCFKKILLVLKIPARIRLGFFLG